jgi:predicted esterase
LAFHTFDFITCALLPQHQFILKRRLSERGYECMYLEAPHLLPMTSMVEIEGQQVEISNGDRENAKAWFMYSKEDPSDASMSLKETPMEYFGLDASISMIRDCLCKFDTDTEVILLGFSQGATMVQIITILADAAQKAPEWNDNLSPFAKIHSAILISGFASMHRGSLADSLQATDDKEPITISSLHIMGANDTSVPKPLGDKLAACYLDPQIYIHEKGHFIPHNKAMIEAVTGFLEATEE